MEIDEMVDLGILQVLDLQLRVGFGVGVTNVGVETPNMSSVTSPPPSTLGREHPST